MNNKDMPAHPGVRYCTEKEASLLLAEALEAFKEVAAIFNRVEEAALAELEKENKELTYAILSAIHPPVNLEKE